jgi:hypothetical protein
MLDTRVVGWCCDEVDVAAVVVIVLIGARNCPFFLNPLWLQREEAHQRMPKHFDQLFDQSSSTIAFVKLLISGSKEDMHHFYGIYDVTLKLYLNKNYNYVHTYSTVGLRE